MPEESLFCVNHPNRETSLRCNRCEKPICTQCAVLTPVGYRCRDCIRGQQKVFETARWVDLLVAFIVTGTDRLMHYMFSAYADEGHKYHNEFIEYFRLVDELFGRIFDAVDENMLLLMMSDHGFEEIKSDVFINAWFRLKSIPDDAKPNAVQSPFPHRSKFRRGVVSQIIHFRIFIDNIDTMQNNLPAFCIDKAAIFDRNKSTV